VRQVASPLRLSEADPPLRHAPARGEHTRELLRSLCGYSDARLDELSAGGVFGDIGPVERVAAPV
jgi:formyl-CoA transferase